MSDDAERERARYEALSALVDGYRRERDEAREQLYLTKAELGRWVDRETKAARERDEARAEVERLKAEVASSLAMAKIADAKHDQKCAEVDMLRGVGCMEDGDGPCGVCRKCAYHRGAEEMRLACQQWCCAWENNGEAIADALADLRVEDKP